MEVQRCYLALGWLMWQLVRAVVGEEGFEPSQAEPESAVLPLDDSPLDDKPILHLQKLKLV